MSTSALTQFHSAHVAELAAEDKQDAVAMAEIEARRADRERTREAVERAARVAATRAKADETAIEIARLSSAVASGSEQLRNAAAALRPIVETLLCAQRELSDAEFRFHRLTRKLDQHPRPIVATGIPRGLVAGLQLSLRSLSKR